VEIKTYFWQERNLAFVWESLMVEAAGIEIVSEKK
jgi:hypothetical protein